MRLFEKNWEALKINGFKSQIWVGGVVKNPKTYGDIYQTLFFSGIFDHI